MVLKLVNFIKYFIINIYYFLLGLIPNLNVQNDSKYDLRYTRE